MIPLWGNLASKQAFKISHTIMQIRVKASEDSMKSMWGEQCKTSGR